MSGSDELEQEYGPVSTPVAWPMGCLVALFNGVAFVAFGMVVKSHLWALALTSVILIFELGIGLALRRGEHRLTGRILLFGLGFTAALAMPLLLMGICLSVFLSEL